MQETRGHRPRINGCLFINRNHRHSLTPTILELPDTRENFQNSQWAWPGVLHKCQLLMYLSGDRVHKFTCFWYDWCLSSTRILLCWSTTLKPEQECVDELLSASLFDQIFFLPWSVVGLCHTIWAATYYCFHPNLMNWLVSNKSNHLKYDRKKVIKADQNFPEPNVTASDAACFV